MKALIKILVGTIFVIGGLYWYFVNLSLGTGLMNWQAFIVVFKGFFGVFAFLLGLFIVWLEADELRIKKDRKREEEVADKKEELSQAEQIKAAVGASVKKSFICPKCGKEFKTERGLKIHLARAH